MVSATFLMAPGVSMFLRSSETTCLSKSMQYDSGSTSTMTKVPPLIKAALPVAQNVSAGTITSSSGPTPIERRARCSDSVPLETQTP